jgi:hypothetical protein
MLFHQMEIFGSHRRSYVPIAPPPALATTRQVGNRKETPIFEPYEESLPLQSGYYSYVIDQEGHFRVQWGNTRSHATLVHGRPVAAAGRFRVNRMGSVIHVVCGCTDYRFYYSNLDHEGVRYLIDSFHAHSALSLHPEAVFQIQTKLTEKFCVLASGVVIKDFQSRIKDLENEGAGELVPCLASESRIERLSLYQPLPPDQLYAMHLDQVISVLEEADEDGFEYGPAAPRLDLLREPLHAGKNNFVFDEQGWLIVGMKGHQILSGGHDVGGAGHLHIEPTGEVGMVELNFSGHYRPPLTGDYVRYAYRALVEHPLIALSEDCRFRGRKFDEESVKSTVASFTKEEIESEGPELDEFIDSL